MSDIMGITKIDIYAGYVEFADDTFGSITSMMDEDGEDTNDPSEAAAIICEHNIRGPIYFETMNDFTARVAR